MSFWSDFGRGITAHIDAVKFSAKHKLWIYFLVPLLISVLLMIFGFLSIWKLGDQVSLYFMNSIFPHIDGGDGITGKILDFFGGIIGFLVGFVFRTLTFLLLMKYMRYFILILISPVLALVSEKVDELISGKKYPFVLKHFVHDMFRGITVSLRNMFLETIIFIATLLVCWIPLINFFTIPLLMVVGWYFLGFNMMDYSYERRRMKISEGKKFTRKHKGLAMGNGLVYTILLYIPFLGFAFAPVLSVIAATIATLEKVDQEKMTDY
ncbi:hypothetical protein BH09BAC5_BH09BAC5_10740 [soil metagenome]